VTKLLEKFGWENPTWHLPISIFSQKLKTFLICKETASGAEVKVMVTG
jgi:hypothetical protein